MKHMRKLLLEICKLRQGDKKSGVTTVEYAIMLMLVGVAVALFGSGLRDSVTSVFSRLVSTLGAAS